MSEPKRELSIDELKAFSDALNKAITGLQQNALIVMDGFDAVQRSFHELKTIRNDLDIAICKALNAQPKDPAKGGYIPADKPIKAHLSAGEEVYSASDVSGLTPDV